MTTKERVAKCFEANGIQVLSDGVLDILESVSFISTIVELESEFGIEIPDEFLFMDRFSDVDSVVEMMDELMGDTYGNLI